MLSSKIESLLKGNSLNSLLKEREKLTRAYRSNDCRNHISMLATDSQRLAYIASRLPATHSAVYQVLRELIKRSSGTEVLSLLDVGAGPGTALLAAVDASLPLTSATLLERDPGFIAIGKQLTEDFDGIEKKWICQDVNKEFNVSPHDLVIASYSLNELLEKDRLLLVSRLWDLTEKFLIIIEPGSKAAYDSLMKLRQSLLLKGAHLIAPCPHSNACPLSKEDWCHFSSRVERSSFHRKVKNATLNYEDEKFSYLIFSKNQFETCHSRVLRRPIKGEGFLKFQICSKDGIELKTLTKKNKPEYLYSKKIECGDEYSFVN